MPIELSTPIHRVSQDEYHAIDRRALGLAFDIHNEFGRLMDEVVYKTELATRCLAAGMKVVREARARVTHGGFLKDYFIDLLLEDSTVLEAKTVSAITSGHHGQTLNYLHLAGTPHASLVNFRTERVHREFVSTRLSPADRCRFTTEAEGWPADARHDKIRRTLEALAADVGLGLEINLYREALAFLVTGEAQRWSKVPIFSGDRIVGHHDMSLLEPEVALAVTAFPEPEPFRQHLQRLVEHTRLRHVAWVNLNVGKISLDCVVNHGW